MEKEKQIKLIIGGFIFVFAISQLLLILFNSQNTQDKIVCKSCKMEKEIDKENELSLCEQYSELNKIEMRYINGTKYVLLNNDLILEEEVKKSCFRTFKRN